MRVAVVSPYSFDRFGGVQDQVSSLVEWLRSQGIAATAIAPGTGGPEDTVHVGRVVEVPTNRSKAPLGLGPAVIGRVRAALRGFDVVHVHEPLMPLVGIAAVMTTKVPVIGTFHADPGPMARQVYRGGKPMVARIVRRLAAATAVSETAAVPVRSVIDPVIIPNAIDVASFAPPVARMPERVVFVGRDEPRKGLDVLLSAWPKVVSRHPNAQLHVIGATRPARSEGVVFHGRVEAAEKRRILASASVAVAPNLGGESFGIVVVEAMAAGCVVVASSLPAFRTVADDAALLVEAGDPDALADAVDLVLSDDLERSRLSAAALLRAQRFDRDTVFMAYRDLYQSVLGSR